MAISLNNHENRIKALENRSYTLTRLIDESFSASTVKTLYVRDLSKYDFLVCFGDIAFAGGTDPESGNFRAINIIPVKIFDEIWDTSMLFAPTWSTTKNINTSIEVMQNEHFVIIVSDRGSNQTITIQHNPKTNGVLSDNKIFLFGLKLYYNFSYNICSLANSISFHFFKCLINSFKGGVKEIWQLVLRIMTIV